MENPPFRVLILTAGFGDGHNAAAGAIEAALKRLDEEGKAGSGAEVAVCDIFDVTHPGLSRFLKDAYRFGIVHLPRAWKCLYDLSDRVSFKDDSLGLFRKITLRLKAILEEFRPDVVILTYPFYPQLLEAIVGRRGTLPFSVLTVITDTVSINQTWLKGRTNRFFVSDEASKKVLVESGIPAERILATGFPVEPLYGDLLAEGLPDDRWEPPARVLFFPSTPARHVARSLASLRDLSHEIELSLTVVLGRHARRLESTLARWSPRFPKGTLTVVGWTDKVPRLLRDHHVVVGKAGGASVQEAVAARRPIVVNYIVPGQEEGNARHVTGAGCGLIVRDPDELGPTLLSLFANSGKRWLEMSGHAATLAKPHAAREIARIALELASR